ncbi:MAG TPA: PDZ domain-containing protein, partial [Croceibacterium sp.]
MRLPRGLPELKGRWLTAYKVLWWAMLAITVLAVTAGQWRSVQNTETLDMQVFGAGLRPDADGEMLTFSPISDEAEAAGVVPGSVLLAIDGRAVAADLSPTNFEHIARALDGPVGGSVSLRLRRPDRTVGEARIERGPQHLAAADRAEPLTYAQRTFVTSTSRTVNALIVMAGAILLFRRRASDPVAALLSLGLLAVPANDLAWLFSSRAVWSALDYGLDMIPMACILLALTVFPTGRFRPRWTLLIIPAILNWAVLALLEQPDTPILVQMAVVMPAVGLTIASLAWRYVRQEPGPPKQQLKWVMLGFAAFIATGFVEFGLSYLESVTRDNTTYFALVVAASVVSMLQGLFIVGGLLIALLRHRLYDADAAISRSALYAGLTVTLIAVFTIGETLIQALGQEWFGASVGPAGGAIAAALAAVLLVPLHARLNDWARKRFQRDLARLREELPELLAEMRTSSAPKELADDALRLVMRGVHATHGAILIADGGRMALVHAEGVAAEAVGERLGELPDTPSPGVIQAKDPL